MAQARQFRATDVLTSNGDEAVQQVLAMTHGGAQAVLECGD
jgi:threonine dehydrogenase-like Zn-dependent dehydrogenase